jgi:hypothetical protein
MDQIDASNQFVGSYAAQVLEAVSTRLHDGQFWVTLGPLYFVVRECFRGFSHLSCQGSP